MGTVRELWAFRELFYFFVLRDLKVRYKQTVLGIAWAVLQPFFTMTIFTVIFGHFANLPNNGTPYPIFYFCALVPWTFFSTAITNASNSLILNADLLTKIYFPRVILPSSAALSGAIDFAVASVFLASMIIYYELDVGVSLCLWPLLLLPLMLLSLGVGMILAALNVRYRDVKYVVPFGIQLWFFVTPIIYPPGLVPERYQWLFRLNPMSGIIEGFRYSVVPALGMRWDDLGTSLLASAAVFLVGFAFFKRNEKAFADFV